MYDICIIGGGPAGMSAAITAKTINRNLQVCIIEKNPALGKKIYATGNGKCNLSNLHCLDPLAVFKFFDQIGVFTRTDEAGRMYPASEQAADVVAALQDALIAYGVEILTNTLPISIIKNAEEFEIQMANSTIKSKKLLIATGGKAGPQYGNLGEGYVYAKQLGHHINRTFPVLSQLECEGDFQKLKGIRAKGNVSIQKNGHIIGTETGEIQFVEDGLSGICVFNLSRFVRLNPDLPTAEAFQEYVVSIDYVPNMSQLEIETYLEKKISNAKGKANHLLLTMIHSGISLDLLQRAGIKEETDTALLSREDLKVLAFLLKNWECKVTGVKGWKKAQCTGGGVPMTEIDHTSQESKQLKGLYFAGELLDFDGPSGGYNLHFAWESGIKAGKAMADEQI